VAEAWRDTSSAFEFPPSSPTGAMMLRASAASLGEAPPGSTSEPGSGFATAAGFGFVFV
jgi:hypothetical protein